MKSYSKNFKVFGKNITVKLQLDEIADYNNEDVYDDFDWRRVCADVEVTIGIGDCFGQVQYDNQNHFYSTSVDGNSFYVYMKNELVRNFDIPENELDARDFFYEKLESSLIEINKFVCSFAEQEIKKYLLISGKK